MVRTSSEKWRWGKLSGYDNYAIGHCCHYHLQLMQRGNNRAGSRVQRQRSCCDDAGFHHWALLNHPWHPLITRPNRRRWEIHYCPYCFLLRFWKVTEVRLVLSIWAGLKSSGNRVSLPKLVFICWLMSQNRLISHIWLLFTSILTNANHRHWSYNNGCKINSNLCQSQNLWLVV